MKGKYKKSIYITVTLLTILLILIRYANDKVAGSAKDKCYQAILDIPYNKTALLLGTSKHLKSGNINQYFKYRIEAAVDLFKAGKVSFIIISGDNSVIGYDEPTDMKNELIKNGVDSTCIYLDYAGFRTFDSMVRAREIFGQDSLTVVSQHFHNERAIYIAQRLGMHAIGYDAKNVGKSYGIRTHIREYFARVKVLADFMIGVEPKFLGEKIEIK